MDDEHDRTSRVLGMAVVTAVTAVVLVVVLALATAVIAALVLGFTAQPVATGLAVVALTVVAAVAVGALRGRRLAAGAPDLDLTPEQRIEIRQVRELDGPVRAVSLLREWHPELTLAQARRGIRDL